MTHTEELVEEMTSDQYSRKARFIIGNIGAIGAFLVLRVALGQIPRWLDAVIFLGSLLVANIVAIHRPTRVTLPRNRISWRTFLVVAIVLVLLGKRFAANQLLSSFDAGKAAFDGASYEKAEQRFTTAAVLAQVQFDLRSLCKIRGYLGNSLLEQGKYEKAESTFHAAIRVCNSYGSPSDLIADYASLGASYQYAGSHHEAETAYQEALTLARKNLSADDPQLAAILNNIATIKMSEKQFGEAAQLFEEVLPTMKASNNSGVALVYSNLCQCLSSERKFAEAEPACRKSVELGERAFGPTSPEIAAPLNNLAMLLKSEKKYDEAAGLLQRAISNLEHSPVTDPSRVAVIKKNYFELKREVGDR